MGVTFFSSYSSQTASLHVGAKCRDLQGVFEVGFIFIDICRPSRQADRRFWPFAEPSVRIQPRQRVIDTGPYAIVRHSMYSFSFRLAAGIALSGSYWALLSAAIVGVGVLVRTALEDRMLQRELPGYQEYARRVQYRILPGVW